MSHHLAPLLLGAALLLAVGAGAETHAAGGTPASAERPPLKPLARIWLVVHALNWLEITPGDPRRKTPQWEQWPGRCEICYQYEQPLKKKYYALLSTPDEEAGVFVLPSGMKGDPPLVEVARRTFGARCVVSRLALCSQAATREALGEEFVAGIAADRRRAERVRGPGLTEGEIAAWERAKGWATDLRAQLEANGYTFNPSRVQIQALGEDWCGCAATYPIHMGRAWRLRQPILRRFDLINPDCSPLLLRATLVEQNIRLPKNVRLFIFKSAEGRHVAQFWEGMHGLYDRPHVAVVTFPPQSAKLTDTLGRPHDDAVGGEMTLGIGCGGHTPHGASLVQAEAGLSLREFRQALVTAEIRDL